MRGAGEVVAGAVDKVEAVDEAVASFGVVGKYALGFGGRAAEAGAVAAGRHELDGVHCVTRVGEVAFESRVKDGREEGARGQAKR
jgi:hypothetical protein